MKTKPSTRAGMARPDQSLKATLRNSNAYAHAQTELAQQQAARVRQLREAAAERLVDVEEFLPIYTRAMSGGRALLLGLHARVRAAFPDLPPEAYEFIRNDVKESLALFDAPGLGLPGNADRTDE
jgi:hypothetical protein